MNIQTATRRYETWLSAQARLDQEALQNKRKQMGRDSFRFLRATFYRWAQHWPRLCPELAQAPQVLAVGDLHIENFGIWRNAQNDLVWGINDFDDSWPLPYTQDLTRLAASIFLAREANLLDIKFKTACQSVLDGYVQCLESGGKPFLQTEQPAWMQKSFAESIEARSEGFWESLREMPPLSPDDVPTLARQVLFDVMGKRPCTFHKRIAGLGSLGKPRWVALAKWEDLAWETKALSFSAWSWAHPPKTGPRLHYSEILTKAIRSRDEALTPLEKEGWILRKLSPERAKLNMKSLSRDNKDEALLFNMGWETANIHLGTSPARQAILEDVQQRPQEWLQEAGQRMAEAIEADWRSWD